MEIKNALRTDMEHELAYYDEVFNEVDGNRKRFERQAEEAKKEMNDLIELANESDENQKRDFWPLIANAKEEYAAKIKEAKRYQNIGNKPFFGRIIYDNESIYIGRKGIRRNIVEQLVVDWRAPIANAYYENGLGQMSFRGPLGDEFNINLKLKRTFDFTDGRLTSFFDSEAATNDELLNKYLARNKQAVLGEIIATIQKEQNDIIRLSPKHNVIVQGVAGSGKTTVAMHRISYILYNFSDMITPRDFYIIGSNKILLQYITGVLPDLDVSGFNQMTMEELFVRLLYEDWDRFTCRIKDINKDDASVSVKGTALFFDRLKEYCDKYERANISTKDVYLEPNQYVEGLDENGKNGIYDRRDNPVDRKGAPVRLLAGSAIENYIETHPLTSMQSKIDALNEEIRDNVENILARPGMSYTAREKKVIKRDYEHWLGDKEFKGSIFKLYGEFLSSLTDIGVNKLKSYYTDLPQNIDENGKSKYSNKGRILTTEYDIYDLAALAYIYRRIKETEVISEAHHIVIDEAQDYGVFAYKVLNECIRDCTYTIMGDVSQNIRYDSGINDWSCIRDIFLKNEKDSFMMLRKSYRNTVEISEFATKILDHGDFEVYPAEPIIRHGDEPKVIKTEKASLTDETIKQCQEWQKEGYETIAIVCRTDKEAEKLKGELQEKIEIRNIDAENTEFGNGIMVLPVALTKGLEFDAVLIYEPSKRDYPVDNRHAKLLYVAATRALHRLTCIYSNSLTELISKPVAADKVRHVIVDEKPQGPSENEIRAEEERVRKMMEADNDLSKMKILEESTKRTKNYLNERSNAVASGKTAAGAAALTGNVGGLGKSRGYTEYSYASDIKPAAGQKTGAVSNKVRSGLKDRKNVENPSKEYKVPDFIAPVPENLLRPSGHGAPSFATKWVRREKDGVYFVSNYGTTRICPISSSVVRVSFSRGMMLNLPQARDFKAFRMTGECGFKDGGQVAEFTTKNLIIRFDKYRGAVTFLDSKKSEILKEKQTEPRFVDDRREKITCFTNFEVTSSNAFHIYGDSMDNLKYISEDAYYISPVDGKLPCIMKKDKFAIIPLTKSKLAFCKKPVVGTFIMQEDDFSDYYFVFADSTEKLMKNYENLV